MPPSPETAGRAPVHLVDAHAHLMTPERIASGVRWIRRVVPDYANLEERSTAEDLLGHLAAAGAEAVFSFFYPLRPGESDRLNRWQAELAAAHRPDEGPERDRPVVVAFASVHAGDESPGRLVEQALNRLDLAGLKLHPYVQRLDPLDPRLDPALAATEEAGRPLVLHTGFAGFYDASPLRDAVFELAARYPRLRIIVAHLLYPDLPISAWPRHLESHPNLYLDATNVLSAVGPATADGETLAALLEHYSHRFTFGSDYPMGMAFPVSKLYLLARTIAPSQRALDDLSWRTAARLVERRRLPAALAADL